MIHFGLYTTKDSEGFGSLLGLFSYDIILYRGDGLQ